jgi:uracil-DNA glycosylase
MDSRARILIASQAPGRRVHESGVPFDDASGERLRAWMEIEPAVFYDPTRVAILPMGFCYPGTGTSGDLPPRPECAPAWREQLLGSMPSLRLQLIIGRYALDYHLANRQKANLTETVRAWRDFWPQVLPLPHPSPRNNPWLKKNPWFENEVIPVLRHRLRSLFRQ